MGGVTVAYSGTHQAYQIALAADEAGVLDRFYCSLYDAPGFWGGAIARVVGADRLVSRKADGINLAKVREHPWPMLGHELRARIQPSRKDDWLAANESFDRHVAARLKQSPPKIFVGVETCAQHCFEAGKKLGTLLVLDHPPIPAATLNRYACRSADELGLPAPAAMHPNDMAERRFVELSLADRVLVYSDFHAASLQGTGVEAQKLVLIPLWVDAKFWSATPMRKSTGLAPLRVLFVGGINLRKGVPYLLRAIEANTSPIELTLVGSVAPEVQPALKRFGRQFTLLKPQTKPRLREIYRSHHLLVLPSLGDSWGFVALEAMACGLPVVVTENCGIPLPDESWRVPVRNVAAITSRLELYAKDRDLCRAHGAIAVDFAAQFTLQRYRRAMSRFLTELATTSGV